MRKALARRLATLEDAMHEDAFAMGAALVRDGELVGLGPLTRGGSAAGLISWARDPRPGFVFIITADADGRDMAMPSDEIHPDVRVQLERTLSPIGAVLHLT